MDKNEKGKRAVGFINLQLGYASTFAKPPNADLIQSLTEELAIPQSDLST